MKVIGRLSPAAAFAGLASLLTITSCSLPPQEAWAQIKRDGLIAFLSNQHLEPAYAPATPREPGPKGVTLASKGSSSHLDREQLVGPPSPPASLVKPHTAPPTVASTSPSPKVETPAPETPRNIMPPPDKPQLATTVPSLPGFVRSPYTTPPRLVDVKGAKPGATMICPYTQRPFIVPSDYLNEADAAALASNANPPATTKPAPQPPVIAAQNNPPASNPPASALFNNSGKSSAPAGTPAPNKTASNAPANSLFNKTETPANNAAAGKTAAPEIPYGIPIPNRPGFVNSPFAARHQLVDVTGLPVGMEVKCPYTGKLFRVPASDVAEQKSLAAPGVIPEPEKVEKK